MSKIFNPIETRILYGEGTIESEFIVNGIFIYTENRVEIDSGYAYVIDETDVQIEKLSIYDERYSDLKDFVYTATRDFENDRTFDIVYEIHNDKFKGELVFRDHVDISKWTENLYKKLKKYISDYKQSEIISNEYIYKSINDYALEVSLNVAMKYKIGNLEIEITGMKDIVDDEFFNFELISVKIKDIEIPENSKLFKMFDNEYVEFVPQYSEGDGYIIAIEIKDAIGFEQWISCVTKEFLKFAIKKNK